MIDTQERVIVVDPSDTEVGTAEKLTAHSLGLLHRAFSVFVLNSRREILLQRRAESKYHTGGLWSNTCCGHPRPGEELARAARRRLREEMGFECDLERLFSFRYRAELGEGLSEHEIDHVFIGWYEDDPEPSPGEVAEWRWVAPTELRRELADRPLEFTPWFGPALSELLDRRFPAAPATG